MIGKTMAHSVSTDPRSLSDEDLGQLRRDVLTEQERRENLAQIPGHITELREKYVAGGGDPDDLP